MTEDQSTKPKHVAKRGRATYAEARRSEARGLSRGSRSRLWVAGSAALALAAAGMFAVSAVPGDQDASEITAATSYASGMGAPSQPSVNSAPAEVPVVESPYAEVVDKPVLSSAPTEGDEQGEPVVRARAERAESAGGGSLLERASELKDVSEFAPGSGPNSSERMGEWLASNRKVKEGTPRADAVRLLDDYGFGLGQWACLDRMWWHESGWDPQTTDAMQGTGYGELDPSLTWGIPQANPASKMASAGDDWATNPVTQIRWGLGYIKDVYGSPCKAWAAWRERAASGSYGWY